MASRMSNTSNSQRLELRKQTNISSPSWQTHWSSIQYRGRSHCVTAQTSTHLCRTQHFTLIRIVLSILQSSPSMVKKWVILATITIYNFSMMRSAKIRNSWHPLQKLCTIHTRKYARKWRTCVVRDISASVHPPNQVENMARPHLIKQMERH